MREVGPFEILEPLGAGGMGEVFKARDRRLNRFVALKFLPETATPAARERFQREALAIAALNHPNICTLYEVGDEGGRPYLVLELLEGETLRARLRRAGAAPAEQVLDWALETADALDAAHRKGVLHRDLKPENLWVTSNGHIKVLDFGLARLETGDAAEAATINPDQILTSPGQTMGTIPYMSPEQARGEALDARSDLFSFGSVLYEIATGKPAFPAKSAADTLAAILRGEPVPLRQLRPELPPKLEEVASRCLEKDPDLRYQSAADLRSDLKRLKRETEASVAAAPVSSSAPASLPVAPALPSDSQILGAVLRRHWRGPAAVVVIVLAAAFGAYWRWGRTAAAPPPALAFRQITFSGDVQAAAISPDGKFLAHVDRIPAGTSLYLLSVATGSDVTIVPPGGQCCQSPSFSPDGNLVYFTEASDLFAVPVLGGAVRGIAHGVCSGAAFSPDGSQIAYIALATKGTNLVLARADGSQPRVLHRPASGLGYVSACWDGPDSYPPAWSPDGRWIAADEVGTGRDGHIELVSASDGHTLDLAADVGLGAADLSWLPNGRGLIFAAPIPDTAIPQVWMVSYPGGRATQITSDLQGYASASVSASGELVVVHAVPQYSIWVQTSADSPFQQLPGGGETQDGTNGLAWTPQDGLVTIRVLGGQTQLWTEAGDGSAPRPISSAETENVGGPVAAPNGQIVFLSGNDLYRVNGDGTGLTDLAHAGAGDLIGNPTLILSGREVAYLDLEKQGNQILWTVPLAGGAPRQFWNGFVHGYGNPASPDGTRIFAFTLGADRTWDGVVFRADGGSPQVTHVDMPHTNDMIPLGWTPDGRAITYVVHHGSVANIWAYPLDGSPSHALTNFTSLNIAAYAYSHDGRLAVSRGSANADAAVAPIH